MSFDVPPELTDKIFSLLKPRDLINGALVNKTLNIICTHLLYNNINLPTIDKISRFAQSTSPENMTSLLRQTTISISIGRLVPAEIAGQTMSMQEYDQLIAGKVIIILSKCNALQNIELWMAPTHKMLALLAVHNLFSNLERFSGPWIYTAQSAISIDNGNISPAPSPYILYLQVPHHQFFPHLTHLSISCT
ncbi:hypothetical protein C8J56DRAFT_1050888 [Mycena floridula]|nr:hypothetical protein C8J56DRAFT_1050888 [Mycena floridula]